MTRPGEMGKTGRKAFAITFLGCLGVMAAIAVAVIVVFVLTATF